MAVVGKGFAVLQSGPFQLSGFVAWVAWAAVHLEFLGQSSLRVSVFVQWVWTYLTGQRGSCLIVNDYASTKHVEEQPVRQVRARRSARASPFSRTESRGQERPSQGLSGSRWNLCTRVGEE